MKIFNWEKNKTLYRYLKNGDLIIFKIADKLKSYISAGCRILSEIRRFFLLVLTGSVFTEHYQTFTSR